VERDEDKSWQGEKEATARMYRMSKEEDSLLGREASMQALFAQQDTVRVQSYDEESSTEDRLHGYVG
jgi:hypothetical protein